MVRTAGTTPERFESGSPMPMKTTLVTRPTSDPRRAGCCSGARPARRSGPRRDCRRARQAPRHRSGSPPGSRPARDARRAPVIGGDHHALGLARGCPARRLRRARERECARLSGAIETGRSSPSCRPLDEQFLHAVGCPLVGEHIAGHERSSPRRASRARAWRGSTSPPDRRRPLRTPSPGSAWRGRPPSAGRYRTTRRGLGRVTKDVIRRVLHRFRR
jgi:hypothetical protein